MKKMHTLLAIAAALVASATTSVQATPEEDLKAMQEFYTGKFKDTKLADYGNGAFIFSADAYEQWKAMEEFPVYEDEVNKGEKIWSTPFKNGKTFADCLGEVSTVRAKYPMYDEAKDTVLTLEGEINACLKANGEEPLKPKKGELAQLSAYIALQARGQKVDVKIPNDKALAWYERGKQHFYTKRGQLNLSCADCHVANAGNRIRAELLSPVVGQAIHFPLYRVKWGELGTLHRRYEGCNEQVRARPFKSESDEFKALEYFHTYMSNGLDWIGPTYRK